MPNLDAVFEFLLPGLFVRNDQVGRKMSIPISPIWMRLPSWDEHEV
jgi:hypothetical protein